MGDVNIHENQESGKVFLFLRRCFPVSPAISGRVGRSIRKRESSEDLRVLLRKRVTSNVGLVHEELFEGSEIFERHNECGAVNNDFFEMFSATILIILTFRIRCSFVFDSALTQRGNLCIPPPPPYFR